MADSTDAPATDALTYTLSTVDGRMVAVWSDGRVHPIVSGGDGDETPPPPDTPRPSDQPDQPTADDSGNDEEPPPELGDPGKQALDRMKADRNAARDEAKALRAELDELRTSQMSDHERQIKEAADAARSEVLAEVNSKLFAAELRGAARGDITITDDEGNDQVVRLVDPDLLATPEVAVQLLGLGDIPVTESGDIDTEAISDAVTALVKAKPYLASATPPGNATPQPPPDIGNGARGTKTERQLTRGDLASMSAEQINEARAKGLLDNVLAGRS